MLLTHIHQLHRVAENGESRKSGASMRDTCMTENAWLLIEGDRIAGYGMMDTVPPVDEDTEIIDCSGALVLPGFVDSHTHLVYAQARDAEYVDRIRGLSYEEIAERGGGILNSAARLREMSEEELLDEAVARAWEILRLGTTTVEIKSGYGLTVEDELKMLRVAKKIPLYCPINVRTTFLGAHAYPAEFRENHDGYIDRIVNEMIPAISQDELADFIDVFCEKGYFSVEDTRRILEAAHEDGISDVKLHVNQFNSIGGIELAVERNAVSVDHLEVLSEAEMAVLKESDTIPTVLPGCSFFLGIDYAPARHMIQAGLPVCLASDYNPGSAPSGDMQFMMSLACTKMRILPEEALTAMTINGAAALQMSDEVGSIEVGKRADLLITVPMPQLSQLPYYHNRDQVAAVIAGGRYLPK